MSYWRSDKSVIIGKGYVGKASGFALQINNFIDKQKKYIEEQYSVYDYYFICLPTPTDKNGIQDISAIEEWLDRLSKLKNKEKKIIIIRSTILPGTTKRLSAKYQLNISHIPEFLSEDTAIYDTLNPVFVVIGSDDIVVREELKKLFLPLEHEINFISCDSVTAEMIKYTMNCFFATKVVYCNHIYDICQKNKANYKYIKQALESHPYGMNNHTQIFYKFGRGINGNCLPKDLKAFANYYNSELFKKIIEIDYEIKRTTNKNNKCKL